MNKFFIAAAIAGTVAAPAIAEQARQGVETKVENQVATAAGGTVEASDPAAAAIVADCSARKFETSVELEKNGQKRLTKLKLCAAQGEDQTTWVRTLEDAKVKISAHPSISDESKVKIAAELDTEIARIKTVEGPSLSLPAAPPLPVSRTPEYGVYQPLPTLPSVATASAPATSTSTPVQARPRLTIRCLTPGETGKWSPCTSLQRTTQLTIHADQDLAGGTRLRFLRRGDARGEILLAGMRQGQLIRSTLPPQLCAGVASSKVEIQIMGSTQVFETLGPYQLRC